MPTKPPLTDAMRDSHKVSLSLHLAVATRLIESGNLSGAKDALDEAFYHANSVGHPEYKSRVFSTLNSVRARLRKRA